MIRGGSDVSNTGASGGARHSGVSRTSINLFPCSGRVHRSTFGNPSDWRLLLEVTDEASGSVFAFE